MQKIGAIIDRLPLQMLIVMTIFLGLAPYIPTFAEPPHLYAKLVMLAHGTLTRPIDIFDLFMHATPAVLLTIRVVRILRKKAEG
jgi:hypothetical protein